MADRRTHNETWSCTAPLHVGAVTLLVVVRVVRRADCSDRHARVSWEKSPEGVVVRDACGMRAINACGAALELESLRRCAPDLDAAWGTVPAQPVAGSTPSPAPGH